MGPEGNKPLILHVNDSTIGRYVTDALLRRSGFEAKSISLGKETFDSLDPEPDLILLDVRLPDIDGYEVCRRLKASPKTAHIPVLLTSAAFVSSESKVAGLDSGADGYLVQPFEPAELKATVMALLRVRLAERSARDALRSRDDFLSVASHELRTPITSVSLQHEKLLRRLQQGNEVPREEMMKTLQAAQRGVHRLRELVVSLLDVSRVESGKLQLHLEPMNLAEVVRELVASLEEQLKRENGFVELQLVDAVGCWDRTRLEQILVNLISNAAKYGPGGSIQVSLKDVEGGYRLSVHDQGSGIDPKDHERIFQRYERTNVDINRPGFGLGLWIVREIARAMGGDITVESSRGEGAAFHVFLPHGKS